MSDTPNDTAEGTASEAEAAEETTQNEETAQESAPKESPNGDSSISERYTRSMEQAVLEAPEITIESLLKAGAHFGHQAHRWNPKMMPYLFGEKNGIHIINLDYTYELWKKAEKFLEEKANRGGNILFVGTKSQAREMVEQAAESCGGFSITQRWLGGTLSNFETIKRSISRMRKLEELLQKVKEPDSNVKLNKKEQLGITRELEKLNSNLGGIRAMKHIPDVLFVLDIKREAIAVREARKLHIPVVGLVDSNVDPTVVDFPIPSNDDASKTIKLFVENVAAAVSRGRSAFLSRGPEQVEAKKKGGAESESLEVVKKGKSRSEDTPEPNAAAAV